MKGQRIYTISFLAVSVFSLKAECENLSRDVDVVNEFDKTPFPLRCHNSPEATNGSWATGQGATSVVPAETAIITRPSNTSLNNISETPRNSSSVASNHQGRRKIRFCDVPDDEEEQLWHVNGTGRRVRRYILQGKKWDKTDLTWTLRTPSRHVDRMSSGIIRQQMSSAMRVWERESTLTFTEVHKDTPDVDIYIDFVVGDHKDGYKFDGPGRTLAHAFYPGRGIGGDMHFDDEENFVAHHSVEKYKSTSLLITAAHELGHALGLRHSDMDGALMAPYYQEFEDDFKLPDDDKYGIQALYGRPQSHETTTTYRPRTTPSRPPTTPYRPPTTPYRPPTTPYRPPTEPPKPPATPSRPRTTPYRPPYVPPTPPPRPTLAPKPPATPPTTPHVPPTTPSTPPESVPTCPARPPAPDLPDSCDTDFDAVTKFRNEFYFFKDDFYWRISRKGYLHRFESPNKIRNRFHGLPRKVKRVDAVYVSRQDTFVFFSGPSYYELGQSLWLTKRGNLIDLGVNASHLDAAMVWGHNGRVYLFSGDHYWRLGRDGHAEPDYPRDVAVWRGLPRNYSAAFTVRSSTYFLAGRVFWSFDSLKMRMSEPPSLVAPYWFSCPYYKQDRLLLCSPRPRSAASPVQLSLCLHIYYWLTIFCLSTLYTSAPFYF